MGGPNGEKPQLRLPSIDEGRSKSTPKVVVQCYESLRLSAIENIEKGKWKSLLLTWIRRETESPHAHQESHGLCFVKSLPTVVPPTYEKRNLVKRKKNEKLLQVFYFPEIVKKFQTSPQRVLTFGT